MIIIIYGLLYIFTVFDMQVQSAMNIPIVINTWEFSVGTVRAWEVLYNEKKSALDAVEAGCSECEKMQTDFTVGFGGSPDENGETTLDAMIMDGPSHNVGAVAGLRRVKSAISVARKVLENTNHSMLVGSLATEFAISMGFKDESLTTNYSLDLWKKWKSNICQPNFWTNVSPDPKSSCGPYKPMKTLTVESNNVSENVFGRFNHDTVGMLAIDFEGQLAAGTSSNGAIHKIPGRVGDSPIVGAGAYVDQDIGGAAATGDGDIMMRLLPSYQIVENMRNGMSPADAAANAMKRIVSKFPSFSGGLIALSKYGEYGAACHGLKKFPYMVQNAQLGNATVHYINCI